MKQLWAMAFNDLRIEFSDKGTWLQFLILPLIFTAVVGVGTGGLAGDPDADPRYAAALVNEDSGALAAQVVEALGQSQTVRAEALTESEAQTLLDDNQTTAIIIIPATFSADLLAGKAVEIEVRATAESTGAFAVREAVQAATAQVSRALLAASVSVEEAEAIRPFADVAERQAYFDAALKMATDAAKDAPVAVDNTQAAESLITSIPNGFALSSPGQLVTWVLATLLAGAVTLVSERNMGTLRRLLTMPAPKWSILGGKILGRFTQGALQMAVMIGAGLFLFNVPWGNSPAALVMVAIAFGLAATALGVFLATLARSEQQVGGFVSLFTFLLAPLGGAWIPLEITPTAFQQVAQIFPTTWAMRGFTDVIVRGQGPQGVLLECGVLLGFAALFFALGIWRFKYE